MFKKLIVVCCLVACLVGFGVVLGTTYVWDTYSFDYGDGAVSLAAEHPSSTGYKSGVSQGFSFTDDAYMTSVYVGLSKYGSPNGTVTCVVMYSSDGTVGGYPNGTVIEVSMNTYDLLTDINATNHVFSFWFTETKLLSAGVGYFFCLYLTGDQDVDTSHYWKVECDTSSWADDGKCIFYAGSTWDNAALNGDLVFEAYGNTVSSIDLDPDNGDGGEGSGSGYIPVSGNRFSVGAQFGAVVLALFVPAFLLVILKCGKWGFIGGMVAGAVAGGMFCR